MDQLNIVPKELIKTMHSDTRQPIARRDTRFSFIAKGLVAGTAISLGVFALRWMLNPVLGEKTPYALGILGIIVSAYYFRFWAGIAATIFTIVLGESILAPENRFLISRPDSVVSLLFLFAIGLLISLACEGLHLGHAKLLERERNAVDLAQESAHAYQLLNSVLNSVPVSVGFFDPSGRFLRSNSGSILRNELFVGKTPVEIFELGGNELHSAIQSIATDRSTPGQIDVSLIRKNGVEIWLAANLAPMYDDFGRLTGVCMIALDMSERKLIELNRERALEYERNARSEAETASKMKDDFVATLSHELRTPLTGILGWIDLMRLREKDHDVVANGIDAIEKSGRIQLQMVEDLLDLNRIISGKMTLEKAWFDVDEMIESAIASVQLTAEAKGIAIESEVESGLQLFGDPGRIQQIVTNLLSNAIKFSISESTIWIRVAAIGDSIRIMVTDTGEGIEPNFLPHVFDRFRQGDSSIARRHGGLGLGLSIVKQLAEMHGGRAEATSDGKGKGSSFSIWFPLTSSSSKIPLRPGRTGDLVLGDDVLKGIRILLVDDDDAARDVIRTLLETYGAEVFVEADADNGLASIQKNAPNIILSDIGMPGLDGFKFLQMIRSLPAKDGGLTPTIALTAFARLEDRRDTLRAGFQAHVTKPVDVVELVSNVRNLSSSAKIEAQSRNRRNLTPANPIDR